MPRRLLAALPVFLLCSSLFCTLFGCGSQEDHPPATLQGQVKNVENNANMSPEQKAAAEESLRMHQQNAAAMGAAHRRAMSKQSQ